MINIWSYVYGLLLIGRLRFYSDDEMEATSRSIRCLQKRNENDSDI